MITGLITLQPEPDLREVFPQHDGSPDREPIHLRLEVDPPEEDTDDEITDVVRMVLEKDPLVHASQLRVGTAGGVVEMRGLVASDEERRLAVLDAWYVPGVWEVADRIEVSPPT